jgi:hypothetical protein
VHTPFVKRGANVQKFFQKQPAILFPTF